MQQDKATLGAVVITVMVGLLVVLGLPLGAHATQITLSDSGIQDITFQGHGDNTLTVSTSGLSGNAYFGTDIGTYTLSGTTFTAGPPSNGLYAAGSNTQNFEYDGNDGDKLIGTVTWTVIQDHTNQPKFFGTLAITSASGDTTFVNNWLGLTARIDFTTNPLDPNQFLDAVAAGNGSATATISSGEVAPTPEPNATLLLAGGLGLVGLVVRRQPSKAVRECMRRQ